MFLKSWPVDQVEGLHVAVLLSEAAAAAADPTIRARDAARSIIVSNGCSVSEVRSLCGSAECRRCSFYRLHVWRGF